VPQIDHANLWISIVALGIWLSVVILIGYVFWDRIPRYATFYIAAILWGLGVLYWIWQTVTIFPNILPQGLDELLPGLRSAFTVFLLLLTGAAGSHQFLVYYSIHELDRGNGANTTIHQTGGWVGTRAEKLLRVAVIILLLGAGGEIPHRWHDVCAIFVHPTACALRFQSVSDGYPLNEILRDFESEFQSQSTECSILIVRAPVNSARWIAAGYSDEGKFQTVVIDDSSHELLQELKKEPINTRRIVALVTVKLGRTPPILLYGQTQSKYFAVWSLGLFVFLLLWDAGSFREAHRGHLLAGLSQDLKILISSLIPGTTNVSGWDARHMYLMTDLYGFLFWLLVSTAIFNGKANGWLILLTILPAILYVSVLAGRLLDVNRDAS
jgi:hypothetical protein